MVERPVTSASGAERKPGRSTLVYEDDGDLPAPWGSFDFSTLAIRSSASPGGKARRIVLKVLPDGADEAETDAFLGDARSVAALSHRNLVESFGVVHHLGKWAWVMERLDGVRLSEFGRADVTPAIALRIVADVLAGIHHIHQKAGRSANIDADHVFVTVEGRIKLLLSRLGPLTGLAGADVRADIVSAGALLEQLIGSANVAPSVRALVVKASSADVGTTPLTAHAMSVSVEQCAAAIRPPATPASLASLASLLLRRRASEVTQVSTVPAPAPVPPPSSRVASAAEELHRPRSESSPANSSVATSEPFAPPPAPAAEPAFAAWPLYSALPSRQESPPPSPLRLHEDDPVSDGSLEVMARHVSADHDGSEVGDGEVTRQVPSAVAASPPAALRARVLSPTPQATPSPDGGFWPSMRNRNFALMMGCFTIANSGARMQTAALSWLIFKRTNDPIYLGWFGLAFAVPMLLLAPLGGVLADRVERVRIIVFAKAMYLALSIGLVLLVRTSSLGVGTILAAQALSAVLLAFEHPTRLSLVPDFVPRKHLQNALAVNGIVNYATVFIGPAAAGLLLDSHGSTSVFVLAGVAAVAGVVLVIPITGVPARVARNEAVRDLFVGGLKHVKGDGPVVALLVLAAIVGVSARTYPELLPMFAQRTWGAGAKGYGLLAAASGIGGTTSVALLSLAPNLRHKDAVLLASVAGLCTSLVVFTLSKSMYVAGGVLFVAGACSTVFQNLGTNFIATRVPPSVLGRVLGLYTITLFGLPGFGLLATTSIARRTTGGTALVSAVVLSALALALAAPAVMRREPRARR
jgi:MFS family permease